MADNADPEMTPHAFSASGFARAVDAIRAFENGARPPGDPDLPPMVSSGTSQKWISCQNDTAADIPPCSVVSVDLGTTVEGRNYPNVHKPSTSLSALYGITNTQQSNYPGGVGVTLETAIATWEGSSTPAPGEVWGPKADSFALNKGYPGFRVVKVISADRKLVLVEPIARTVLGKGSLTAASGTTTITPGSGTVTLWVWDGTHYVASSPPQTFTAHNLSTDSISSSDLTKFVEFNGKMIAVTGGGSDQTKVVSVYVSTSDGNGLWAGKVQKYHGGSDFTSDQFDDDGDCLITILNNDLGSIGAGVAYAFTLPVGWLFLGQKIGENDSNVPIYAVRVEENYVFKYTMTADCAAGASVTITLPTTDTVSAVNWSGTLLSNGDKVFVAWDMTGDYGGSWGIWRTGGGGAIELGTISGTLTGGTATISGVTGVSTASNPYGYYADNGSACFVAKAGSGTWYLLSVLPVETNVVISNSDDGTDLYMTRRKMFGNPPKSSATSPEVFAYGEACAEGDE